MNCRRIHVVCYVFLQQVEDGLSWKMKTTNGYVLYKQSACYLQKSKLTDSILVALAVE